MKWTNASLRQHLGERGFLPEGPSLLSNNVYYTTFVRGEDELTLAEYGEGPEPQVFQNGKQVDVSEIGYRNEQIQHDKLKGD
jgi:hypothetical protein